MQSHRLALPWCGAVASRAAARASAGQRRACVTSRRDSDPCSGRSPRTRSSARTWPWSEAEKRCPAPGHCLQRHDVGDELLLKRCSWCSCRWPLSPFLANPGCM
eukprot:scaffold111292_cov50-Phaeocystis_antarctica.AAC.3